MWFSTASLKCEVVNQSRFLWNFTSFFFLATKKYIIVWSTSWVCIFLREGVIHFEKRSYFIKWVKNGKIVQRIKSNLKIKQKNVFSLDWIHVIYWLFCHIYATAGFFLLQMSANSCQWAVQCPKKYSFFLSFVHFFANR